LEVVHFGVPPVQFPLELQVVLRVQAFPSSQLVPVGLRLLVQFPVEALQVGAFQHWLLGGAGQVFGEPPPQVPLDWQVVPSLQASPPEQVWPTFLALVTHEPDWHTSWEQASTAPQAVSSGLLLRTQFPFTQLETLHGSFVVQVFGVPWHAPLPSQRSLSVQALSSLHFVLAGSVS